jgi:hypothetical protein
MAQLSRPFQIAVLALAVLAIASFAVLHRAGGSSSSPSPSVASSSGSSAGASNGSNGASSSPVYHGSAPGVEGLTRDVQRAHAAVAATGRVASETQSKAVQVSPGTSAASVHETTSGGTAPRSTVKPSAVVHSTHATVAPHAAAVARHAAIAPVRTAHAQTGAAAASSADKAPAMQAKVAAELKQGKVVLLLFRNPRAFNDDFVTVVTAVAAHKLGHGVVAHFAKVSELDSFGSITHDIQLYQTPTLLIVNRKHQVTTLTGFIDVFAVEQAVAEARK